VHRCAVPDSNCGHYFSPELSFGEAETLADVGFTGSSTDPPDVQLGKMGNVLFSVT
jgi:hypothetical protein